MANTQANAKKIDKLSLKYRLKADMQRNYALYILIIPVVLYYIIFMYKPMYGALIAFKDYSPVKGILGSDWIGLEYFVKFFTSMECWKLIKNTLVISISSIVFGFPAPIILALLFNELKNQKFKSIAQTISYLPHFISLVVACGLVKTFCESGGVIHTLVTAFGGSELGLLARPECFVPVYVLSGIWQEIGWGSIIYLAALSGIDQELYEAAKIDGANKWKQVLHITIPGIMPTIIIMLILRLGSLMGVGYEKIILLYNESTYATADVISSYLYRVSLKQAEYSFGSAIGLINSIINLIIVVASNKISEKVSDTSLW